LGDLLVFSILDGKAEEVDAAFSQATGPPCFEQTGQGLRTRRSMPVHQPDPAGRLQDSQSYGLAIKPPVIGIGTPVVAG
jgi:hypothetical protein